MGNAPTIDLTKPSPGTGIQGTISTATLTIANGASTTSGSLTAARENGDNKTLIVTATITAKVRRSRSR